MSTPFTPARPHPNPPPGGEGAHSGPVLLPPLPGEGWGGGLPVAQAWWKYGHVWLVIAGPVAVVVAGLVTAWIAFSQQDPVLAQDYYRQGLNINQTLADKAAQAALAPALQGRNHAATPAGAVRAK